MSIHITEYVFYCAETNNIIVSTHKGKKLSVVTIDNISSNKEIQDILIDLITGKFNKTYEYIKIGKL